MMASDSQDFANYLHRRCKYLISTNTEIEAKLSDDKLRLLNQVDEGELSPKDQHVRQVGFRIDFVIGNTFRYTMLAGVYSFLEEALKETSRRVVSDYSQKLKQKKKGSFLSRHIAILTDEGLDTSPIQAHIDKFDALITIRNSIIHAWGKVSANKNPQHLKSCIQKIETAEESKDGFIYLDDQVIPGAIICSKTIIEHILKSMLGVTMYG